MKRQQYFHIDKYTKVCFTFMIRIHILVVDYMLTFANLTIFVGNSTSINVCGYKFLHLVFLEMFVELFFGGEVEVRFKRGWADGEVTCDMEFENLVCFHCLNNCIFYSTVAP